MGVINELFYRFIRCLLKFVVVWLKTAQTVDGQSLNQSGQVVARVADALADVGGEQEGAADDKKEDERQQGAAGATGELHR